MLVPVLKNQNPPDHPHSCPKCGRLIAAKKRICLYCQAWRFFIASGMTILGLLLYRLLLVF